MVVDIYQEKRKMFRYSFILGNIINTWFKVIQFVKLTVHFQGLRFRCNLMYLFTISI